MKKKNGTGGGSRIFALWEKASKAKKIDETSTPNQSAAASGTSHVQLESNLQLALVQAPNAEREPESREATPTVNQSYIVRWDIINLSIKRYRCLYVYV